MPLLRQSLYSQNVNLYLAPTADARDTWLPLMRTVAFEGRAVVLSANQCVRRSQLPSWIKDVEKNPPSTAHARTAEHPRSHAMSTIEGSHDIVWPHNEPKPAHAGVNSEVDGIHLNGESHGSVIDGFRGRPAEDTAVHDSPSPSSPVTLPGQKCRRKSIMTEDQHEITWPDHTSASQGAIRKDPSANISDPVICSGGSCIISPLGNVIAGPIWDVSDDDEENSLLVTEVDFEDCVRGRLDLDVAGSYSRNDAFKLYVDGLTLDPPAGVTVQLQVSFTGI